MKANRNFGRAFFFYFSPSPAICQISRACVEHLRPIRTTNRTHTDNHQRHCRNQDSKRIIIEKSHTCARIAPQFLATAAAKSQRLGHTRLMAAFSLNPTVKSADNLTSFLKKLRDHRGSRGSRQEWRLVFLAPVALPYGEVKNFS